MVGAWHAPGPAAAGFPKVRVLHTAIVPMTNSSSIHQSTGQRVGPRRQYRFQRAGRNSRGIELRLGYPRYSGSDREPPAIDLTGHAYEISGLGVLRKGRSLLLPFSLRLALRNPTSRHDSNRGGSHRFGWGKVDELSVSRSPE